MNETENLHAVEAWLLRYARRSAAEKILFRGEALRGLSRRALGEIIALAVEQPCVFLESIAVGGSIARTKIQSAQAAQTYSARCAGQRARRRREARR